MPEKSQQCRDLRHKSGDDSLVDTELDALMDGWPDEDARRFYEHLGQWPGATGRDDCGNLVRRLADGSLERIERKESGSAPSNLPSTAL